MNWLTLRLAALETFDVLYERGTYERDSPLRRVPFGPVQQALHATGAVAEAAGPVLDELDRAYLYAEPAESAIKRLADVEPAPGPAPGGPPFTFTVALADPAGQVLYLPDDDRDRIDVQLFTDTAAGVTGRLRLDGDIDGDHAYLTRARPQPAPRCPDGPCSHWNAGCGGDGCRCRLFEAQAHGVFERLRGELGVGATRHAIRTLRCHR